MRTNFPLIARSLTYLRATRLGGRLPLSWLVIVLTGMLATVSGNEARITLQSTSLPEPTALSDIFRNDSLRNRHVEVEGLLLPEVRVSPSGSASSSSSFCYVGMIAEPPHMLLIRYPSNLGPGQPRLLTVAGLLRPPERSLEQKLDSVDWQLAGVPVERRFVLIPGLSPRPFWLMASVSAGFLAVTTSLLVWEIMSRVPTSRHEDPESAVA